MDQAQPASAPLHDLIVIGGSAGAQQPLQQILRRLPVGFPAAILVVLHIGEVSHLAEVLEHSSALSVKTAVNGEPVPFGQVRVAPPGLHLLVHDHHLLLRRGPRENLSRPAIDPLFRSAAVSFGGRLISVLLSGALNDGTAGTRAVKRCGGIAVAQQPAEATLPDMPRSAIRHAEVDHILRAAEIPALLERLVARPAGVAPPAPFTIRLEATIAAQEPSSMGRNEKLGRLSPFTCPECQGALWQIHDGTMMRYRCHTGHAFTAESVAIAQARQAEAMLASLMRMHIERAAIARRMAEEAREQGQFDAAARLEHRANDYDQDAGVMRDLLERNTATAPSADEAAD